MGLIESLHFPHIDRKRDAVSEAATEAFEWLLHLDQKGQIKPDVNSFLSSDSAARPTSVVHLTSRDSLLKPSQSLTDCLRSGTGIFWIHAKPGSGKATLIKYLIGCGRTWMLLGEWARDSDLTLADHYFWCSGSDLQKSQEGL